MKRITAVAVLFALIAMPLLAAETPAKPSIGRAVSTTTVVRVR